MVCAVLVAHLCGTFLVLVMQPPARLTTDVTLGLRPRDGLMVINSLWLEHPQDEEYSARLMSSLVFDVPGPVKVELGMVNPLSGPSEQAVRLGTWLEF